MADTLRATVIWGGLLAAVSLPLGLAAVSPYLAYRDAVHIAAGLTGVVALGLLLPQALLIAGWLPLPRPIARRLHRWTGAAIAVCVTLHVAGLWMTSPQDMVDALLFRAPTLFSVWGVLAFLMLVATVCLAFVRHRLSLRRWRRMHGVLAGVFAVTSLAHVLPIIGTMEPVSKAGLCALILAATLLALRSIRHLGPGGG